MQLDNFLFQFYQLNIYYEDQSSGDFSWMKEAVEALMLVNPSIDLSQKIIATLGAELGQLASAHIISRRVLKAPPSPVGCCKDVLVSQK